MGYLMIPLGNFAIPCRVLGDTLEGTWRYLKGYMKIPLAGTWSYIGGVLRNALRGTW